jgi:hypothetical protein
MPNGTSAPGKSPPEFVVPMKLLTYESGSATRAVLEIAVRVAAEGAGERAARPRWSPGDPTTS